MGKKSFRSQIDEIIQNQFGQAAQQFQAHAEYSHQIFDRRFEIGSDCTTNNVADKFRQETSDSRIQYKNCKDNYVCYWCLMEILYRLKLGNFIANGNEEIQKLLQPTPTSDPITGNEASATSSSPGIFQGKLHIFIASCRFLLLTIPVAMGTVLCK